VDERNVGSKAFVTAEVFAGRRFHGRVIEIGRRMGWKDMRTNEPAERMDTRVLERCWSRARARRCR